MQNSKALNQIMQSRFGCLWLFLFIVISLSMPVSARLRSQVDRSELSLGQSLNLMIIVDDFKLKNLSFPFDTSDYQVVANSSSTSFQIINGVTSQNKTYTFTIIPKHAGSITLPSATMTDGLETAQTEPITINVRGGTSPVNPGAGALNSTGTNQSPISNTTNPNTSSNMPSGVSRTQANNPYKENLLARLETNNTNPYKNQQINLKLKIYHRGNLRTLNIPPITVENFIIRKENTAREYKANYNGLEYLVYELNFIAFPIKSGTLTIPQHEIQAILVEDAVMPSNFFDPFGLMNPFLVDQEKTIKTNSLSFLIKDLPPAPKDFSGYVGELAVNNEISNLVTVPGEAITLKTKIYGTGNTKNLSFDLVKNSRLYTAFKDKHKIKEQIENSKQYFETIVSTAIVPSYNSGKMTVEVKPLVSFNPSTGKYEEHGKEIFEISIQSNGTSLSQDTEIDSMNSLTKNQSAIDSSEYETINVSNEQINNYKSAIYEDPKLLFLILVIINFISLIYYIIDKIKYSRSLKNDLNNFSNARKTVTQAGSIAELSRFLRSFSQTLDENQLKTIQPELDGFFLETDQINYGSTSIMLNEASQQEQLAYFKTKAFAILKTLKKGSP
jgi:BatD DUF11 like domain